MIIREGEPVQPRGSTLLEPGDEVLVLTEAEDVRGLQRLFDPRKPRPDAEPG